MQTLMHDRFEVVVGHEGLPVVEAHVHLGAARSDLFQSGRRDDTGIGLLGRGDGVLQVEGDDVGPETG